MASFFGEKKRSSRSRLISPTTTCTGHSAASRPLDERRGLAEPLGALGSGTATKLIEAA